MNEYFVLINAFMSKLEWGYVFAAGFISVMALVFIAHFYEEHKEGVGRSIIAAGLVALCFVFFDEIKQGGVNLIASAKADSEVRTPPDITCYYQANKINEISGEDCE